MTKLSHVAKVEATKARLRIEANKKARDNLRGKVPDDFFNYPPTRELAKEKKEDRYFTGQPCSDFGNIALRQTTDAKCFCDECREKKKNDSKKWRKTNRTAYLKNIEKEKAKSQKIRDLKKAEYREKQRELAKKNI